MSAFTAEIEFNDGMLEVFALPNFGRHLWFCEWADTSRNPYNVLIHYRN